MSDTIKAIWSQDLQCRVERIVVLPGHGIVQMILLEGHCTDMGGAIKVAKAMLPDVNRIFTYSGKEADTRYYLEGDEWSAYLGHNRMGGGKFRGECNQA